MITKFNNRSVALGVIGAFLQMGGLITLALFFSDVPRWAGISLIGGMILGQLLIIVAGCLYAVAKGYSPVFGAFGVLSFFGLFVLAWLPDRSNDLCS